MIKYLEQYEHSIVYSILRSNTTQIIIIIIIDYSIVHSRVVLGVKKFKTIMTK